MNIFNTAPYFVLNFYFQESYSLKKKSVGFVFLCPVLNVLFSCLHLGFWYLGLWRVPASSGLFLVATPQGRHRSCSWSYLTYGNLNLTSRHHSSCIAYGRQQWMPSGLEQCGKAWEMKVWVIYSGSWPVAKKVEPVCKWPSRWVMVLPRSLKKKWNNKLQVLETPWLTMTGTDDGLHTQNYMWCNCGEM